MFHQNDYSFLQLDGLHSKNYYKKYLPMAVKSQTPYKLNKTVFVRGVGGFYTKVLIIYAEYDNSADSYKYVGINQHDQTLMWIWHNDIE